VSAAVPITTKFHDLDFKIKTEKKNQELNIKYSYQLYHLSFF